MQDDLSEAPATLADAPEAEPVPGCANPSCMRLWGTAAPRPVPYSGAGRRPLYCDPKCRNAVNNALKRDTEAAIQLRLDRFAVLLARHEPHRQQLTAALALEKAVLEEITAALSERSATLERWVTEAADAAADASRRAHAAEQQTVQAQRRAEAAEEKAAVDQHLREAAETTTKKARAQAAADARQTLAAKDRVVAAEAITARAHSELQAAQRRENAQRDRADDLAQQLSALKREMELKDGLLSQAIQTSKQADTKARADREGLLQQDAAQLAQITQLQQDLAAGAQKLETAERTTTELTRARLRAEAHAEELLGRAERGEQLVDQLIAPLPLVQDVDGTPGILLGDGTPVLAEANMVLLPPNLPTRQSPSAAHALAAALQAVGLHIDRRVGERSHVLSPPMGATESQ